MSFIFTKNLLFVYANINSQKCLIKVRRQSVIGQVVVHLALQLLEVKDFHRLFHQAINPTMFKC